MAEISCSRQEQADSRQGAEVRPTTTAVRRERRRHPWRRPQPTNHATLAQTANGNACSAGKPKAHRHQAAGVGVGVCASGGIAGASQQAEKRGGLHRFNLWGPAGAQIDREAARGAQRHSGGEQAGRRHNPQVYRRKQRRQRPTSAAGGRWTADRHPAELQRQSPHDLKGSGRGVCIPERVREGLRSNEQVRPVAMGFPARCSWPCGQHAQRGGRHELERRACSPSGPGNADDAMSGASGSERTRCRAERPTSTSGAARRCRLACIVLYPAPASARPSSW